MRNLWSKCLSMLLTCLLTMTGLGGLSASASNITGDIDGDQQITLYDAYDVLNAYSRTSAGYSSGLTHVQATAADVDGDGTITINDAYCVLLYYSYHSAGNHQTWASVVATAATNTSTGSTSTGFSQQNSRTIYITRTGKRYHYDSHCNGGTYYASTLEEALSRGLTPCKKCVNTR